MKNTKDNFQKIILPNGLTILLYRMDSVRSVYAELAIKIGTIHESSDEMGISHFVEHCSLLGTKKYRNKLDIAKQSQRIGASFNGMTNRFATIYWDKFPYNNIFDGLDFLHELVFAPFFDKAEILKERKVVLSEIDDFWSSPERKFWYEFWAGRFGIKHHPYSLQATGDPKKVKDFDENKARNWREKYYVSNNMILTITGNIVFGDVMKIVEKLFGKEKSGLETKDRVFSKEDYSDFNIYHQNDSRSQIIFDVSFPAFGLEDSTRKQRMTLGILNYILSSGSGSRLFQQLRQKKSLVYGINGWTTIYKWLGAVGIESSTSIKNLPEVFKSLRDEIKKIVADGVTDEEFYLARKFMNDSTFLKFDSTVDIAYYISNQEFDYDEIWFPEQYISESEKINKEDVNIMAKKILDFSKINIGLLGSVSPDVVDGIKTIFSKTTEKE